jgi:hypothetical protein
MWRKKPKLAYMCMICEKVIRKEKDGLAVELYGLEGWCSGRGKGSLPQNYWAHRRCLKRVVGKGMHYGYLEDARHRMRLSKEEKKRVLEENIKNVMSDDSLSRKEKEQTLKWAKKRG